MCFQEKHSVTHSKTNGSEEKLSSPQMTRHQWVLIQKFSFVIDTSVTETFFTLCSKTATSETLDADDKH